MTINLRILGCSGGIGGDALRTTSLRVDDDILIDAGTGVGDLTLDELVRIDHVFVTHSHLDHIACLPLMADSVGDLRDKPVVIHAIPEVIQILHDHIFNWKVWPDFTKIPVGQPFLRYEPLAVGQAVELGGRRITALPVDHTVPAVAYRVDSGAASLVFSGDTGPCDAFWEAVNAIDNLRHLIVECAFPDNEMRLAEVSKHFCPAMLAAELGKLQRPCALYITHLKPALSDETMAEAYGALAALKPQRLNGGLVIVF